MAGQTQTERGQHASQWAAVDPITLVTEARSKVYSELSSQPPEVLGPIEEAINRFDQLTRAAMGANSEFAQSPSGGKS